MLLSPLKISPFVSRIASGSTVFTINNSFLLDGVNEYFNVDSLIPNIATDTVGTINILTKSVNQFPSSTARIVSLSDTVGTVSNINIVQNTSGTISIAAILNGVIQFQVQTTAAIDLRSWTLISVVQNATQPIIYINGIAVAKTNLTSTNLTIWMSGLTSIDNFRIGQQSRNGVIDYNYNGYFSQLSYLDTNISAAQVLSFYNNGKPKNPITLFGSNCKFFFNPDNSGSTAQFTVTDSINSINAASVNMEDADKTTTTPYV